MVYCEKILVRYRYMLHENEANQLITCRFSKFLIQLCKKKRFLWGFVLKYYFFGGSCRNITVPRYWASEVLCRALFRGCAEILVLARNIHLWAVAHLWRRGKFKTDAIMSHKLTTWCRVCFNAPPGRNPPPESSLLDLFSPQHSAAIVIFLGSFSESIAH